MILFCFKVMHKEIMKPDLETCAWRSSWFWISTLSKLVVVGGLAVRLTNPDLGWVLIGSLGRIIWELARGVWELGTRHPQMLIDVILGGLTVTILISPIRTGIRRTRWIWGSITEQTTKMGCHVWPHLSKTILGAALLYMAVPLILPNASRELRFAWGAGISIGGTGWDVLRRIGARLRRTNKTDDLAETRHIRLCIDYVLVPTPGDAEPRHHLIEYEQTAVLITLLTQSFQEAGIRLEGSAGRLLEEGA